MQALIDHITLDEDVAGSGLNSTTYYQVYIAFFLTPYNMEGAGIRIPKNSTPEEVAGQLRDLARRLENIKG